MQVTPEYAEGYLDSMTLSSARCPDGILLAMRAIVTNSSPRANRLDNPEYYNFLSHSFLLHVWIFPARVSRR
jgi:hypothetical protein